MNNLITRISSLLDSSEIDLLRNELKIITDEIIRSGLDEIIIADSNNGSEITIPADSLLNDLNQINESQTIKRANHYLKRMVKGFTEVRTNEINDLNLNRWKDYPEVLTDSLWLINKRDSSGVHNAGYWGNFIPQIPNQLLQRYTKKGEWILDPFAGSGTTLIEALRLERNGVGIELQKKSVNLINKHLENEKEYLGNTNSVIDVINADSTKINLEPKLIRLKIPHVHFILYHPPYWDIIQFSKSRSDLSNAGTLENFLDLFGKVLDKTLPSLEKERYFAVVIGDKYTKGEWIPIGFQLMNNIQQRGHKLKSIVVKNFEETTAKRNQKELWRYRAIAGGFYIFKHEYIFIFQKCQ